MSTPRTLGRTGTLLLPVSVSLFLPHPCFLSSPFPSSFQYCSLLSQYFWLHIERDTYACSFIYDAGTEERDSTSIRSKSSDEDDASYLRVANKVLCNGAWLLCLLLFVNAYLLMPFILHTKVVIPKAAPWHCSPRPRRSWRLGEFTTTSKRASSNAQISMLPLSNVSITTPPINRDPTQPSTGLLSACVRSNVHPLIVRIIVGIFPMPLRRTPYTRCRNTPLSCGSSRRVTHDILSLGLRGIAMITLALWVASTRTLG